jgi:tRNA(Ile)-lysidine synthase TilS/MesJ
MAWPRCRRPFSSLLPKHGISAARFDDLMSGLGVPRDEDLAVAVSGGVDSMSLVILTHEWLQAKGKNRALALNVDHKLRSESTTESEGISAQLLDRGIATEIITLSWDAKPTKAQLQVMAREKRHQVMAEACVRRGIRRLLYAHTLNDQVCTATSLLHHCHLAVAPLSHPLSHPCHPTVTLLSHHCHTIVAILRWRPSCFA